MSLTSLFYEEDGSFKYQSVLRPLVSGAIVGVLDNVVLGNKDMNSNLIFAASVSGGTVVGDIVASKVPSYVGEIAILSNNKALSQRVSEVIFGAGTAYVVNDLIIKNPNLYFRNSVSKDAMNKIGCIIIADSVSSYIAGMLETSVRSSMEGFQ